MTVIRDRVAEDGVTKLLDMEASSKIQILNAPIQLPGVCGLCGTSRTDDRQYIDLGLWFEFYGQFYFCTFCMSEMVNRLGGHTPEQAEKIEKELDEARKTILDFQNEKAAVDGAIIALRSTGLFDRDSELPSNVLNYKVSEQISSTSNERIERDESAAISATTKPAKTSGEQRSDDVSTTRSDELDSWL